MRSAVTFLSEATRWGLSIVQSRLRHERPNQTLQATALAHEAYMKLAGQENTHWQTVRSSRVLGPAEAVTAASAAGTTGRPLVSAGELLAHYDLGTAPSAIRAKGGLT